MREINECTAEVFRRSEKRIKMRKNLWIRTLAVCIPLCLVTAICVGVFLPNTTTVVDATDLMANITPYPPKPQEDLSTQNVKATDFAVRLFQANEKNGENVLISPLSVLSALAMTVNGAEGDTLSQMEDVMGMTKDEVNMYLYSYIKRLPQDDKNKLTFANAIWFKDDGNFTVKDDFLQTNADYHNADIYKAPFNDDTLRDVNGWVNENTDGMIPEILDEIDPVSVMYLINALIFDAQWDDIYYENQVKDAEFTTEDGTVRDTELMYDSENVFLEDDNAKGFIKYYDYTSNYTSNYTKEKTYAFVAMLPNEGVSVSEYVASLDGERVAEMLASPIKCRVNTAIPKFDTDYSVDMADVLADMGMTDAFNERKADFDGIGKYNSLFGDNLFISRVLHKTSISVGELGTKAAAVTLVDVKSGSNPPPERIETVYLDRPFVYMIIDCENKVPFFIGTMMDVGE